MSLLQTFPSVSGAWYFQTPALLVKAETEKTLSTLIFSTSSITSSPVPFISRPTFIYVLTQPFLVTLQQIQFQTGLHFSNPLPTGSNSNSDSSWVTSAHFWSKFTSAHPRRPPVTFTSLLVCQTGPFFSLEELILEYQPDLLDPFPLQGCITWDFSKHLSELEVSSLEIQGCGHVSLLWISHSVILVTAANIALVLSSSLQYLLSVSCTKHPSLLAP